MTKVLGVDIGTRRVGLAVCDPGRTVATPLDTIDAGDAGAADWPQEVAARLAGAAAQASCEAVVLGLPRGMSGRDTASTRSARAVAKALGEMGWQVHLWDERLTSAEAERVMLQAGARRQQRRTDRDRVAATLILQGWLDARRG